MDTESHGWIHAINAWLAEKTRGRLLRVRLSILCLMVMLFATIGRASAPPASWATSTSRTYGAFLCPAISGTPAILLSPEIRAAEWDDERRQLTILHEAIHARQALTAGSCWRYNAGLRTSRVNHLRSEAEAHCAEAHQALAWRDLQLAESGRWHTETAAGEEGYRTRWWDWTVRGVSSDLLAAGNYTRIASLGTETVAAEVIAICGPPAPFPAPDHPLLHVSDAPVRAG